MLSISFPQYIILGFISMKKIYGKLPDYSSLCVFRFTYFVLWLHSERTKFFPKSALCVVLGYGISQKGYRCYDQTSQILYASPHVTFLEHIPFYIIPVQSHNMTKLELQAIQLLILYLLFLKNPHLLFLKNHHLLLLKNPHHHDLLLLECPPSF